MVGHSLGTVIILTALQMLHYFYSCGIAKAGRIIHDIIFLGGAAVMNPNGKIEEIYSRSNICSIINGKLTNCYSFKDYVLKYMLFGVISKFEPVGMIPIFEEIKEEEDQKLKKA